MNREFLQLSKPAPADLSSLDVSSYFVSEKLDGCRAIWLPHTRGMPVGDISWANRARDTRDHVATGLWSRYAKPIMAPDWFVAQLPDTQELHRVAGPGQIGIDGELWCGRGLFNKTVSAIKKLVPVESEWRSVTFRAFDVISDYAFYTTGTVNNLIYKHKFEFRTTFGVQLHFERAVGKLMELIAESQATQVHPQSRFMTWDAFNQYLNVVIAGGGEGVILRKMSSTWWPKRVAWSLKVKPLHDAEGVVVGWKPGVGKYEGMMGSLEVQLPDGTTFDLSGFDDVERTLDFDRAKNLTPQHFPIGSRVTYRYRELTPDGKPREARYHRKWEEV